MNWFQAFYVGVFATCFGGPTAALAWWIAGPEVGVVAAVTLLGIVVLVGAGEAVRATEVRSA